MRNLASIQKIKNLEIIESADAVLKATVLGWQVVVKKDEFAIGDLCVYCEIDSLLPKRPEFAMLEAKKYRIKTIKLRGQISQGICFPLSILPADLEIQEGLDVTEILGVKKYEPPIPPGLAGVMKGNFPAFIPKTEETRIQVLEGLLEVNKGEKCYVTEKLDGCSVTYYMKEGELGVCSRNLELKEDDKNILWRMGYKLNIESKLQSLKGNFAVQGEIIGTDIRSNKYKLKGNAIYFFNLFDMDKYQYFDYGKLVETMSILELDLVPIVDSNFILNHTVNDLVEYAIAKSQLNPKLEREGVVIRPLIEKKCKNDRLSFKVINPQFLLKYD